MLNIITAIHPLAMSLCPPSIPLIFLPTKQLLALIAMECPVSNHPDDIRDEKCKVLRCIPALSTDDVVLGQYTAGAAP